MKRKPAIGTIAFFDPARVRPLPGQPRKRFSGIKELAASIKAIKQTTPGQVTLVADDPKYDAQLIDGERRLRACVLAGVEFRAEVCADDTPQQIFARSFASNFGKQTHDPIEIAEGLKRLADDGRMQSELAAIAGRSEGWVWQHLQLLKLPQIVRDLMVPDDDGKAKVTFSHAKDLRGLPAAMQIKLAQRIACGKMSAKKARVEIIGARRSTGNERNGFRSIDRLIGLVENFASAFGRYAELPRSQLEKMIDEAVKPIRQEAVEQLQTLIDDATGLQKAIKAKR